MNEYYVSYTIMGREYQAGPYRSLDEAEDHWRDIKGFQYVTHCYVERGRDARRQLISEAA